MDAALKVPEFMTVEAFLDWDAPPGYLWQLRDGVPQAMSPPSPTHGVIQSRIDRLIGSFLESRASPCRTVITPGVIPASRSDINMLIPDLAVTCSPIQATDRALANPLLLIEVLSPGNQSETWMNVWAYTTIPSVQEIVVLQSQKIGVLVLRRAADGTWPDHPAPITGGELTLESIGFQTSIEEIYRTTWLADSA
nr:Uma2 family endonuclease [uncultured Rhodopila sp.]